MAVVIDEQPVTPCLSDINSPAAYLAANKLIMWYAGQPYYGMGVKSAFSALFESGTFAIIFICFARIIWTMRIAKRLFLFGQLSNCLVGDHEVVKFLSQYRQRQP